LRHRARADELPRPDAVGVLLRRAAPPRPHHQGRPSPRPPAADRGRLALPAPAARQPTHRRRAPARPARRRRPRLQRPGAPAPPPARPPSRSPWPPSPSHTTMTDRPDNSTQAALDSGVHLSAGDPRPALVIRRLDELLIAAEPERWAALGLAVGADGVAQVGTIRLRLGAPGEPGIAGWRVRGLADGDLDGLPTQGSDAPPRAPAPAADHPLGALAIDHVVVATPDLGRTIAALEGAGLQLRRVREAGPTARQGFLVVGDAILEVVGPDERDG